MLITNNNRNVIYMLALKKIAKDPSYQANIFSVDKGIKYFNKIHGKPHIQTQSFIINKVSLNIVKLGIL